jgi:hypothetical protein
VTVFFTRAANGRGYPVYDHDSTYRRHWTPQEIATLARGFIDHDLDGPELHAWCRKQGIDRTPGAIDYKLSDLNFFSEPDTQPKQLHQIRERRLEQALATAKRNLANQIKLAKLELATGGVPPYKPRALEW